MNLQPWPRAPNTNVHHTGATGNCKYKELGRDAGKGSISSALESNQEFLTDRVIITLDLVFTQLCF